MMMMVMIFSFFSDGINEMRDHSPLDRLAENLPHRHRDSSRAPHRLQHPGFSSREGRLSLRTAACIARTSSFCSTGCKLMYLIAWNPAVPVFLGNGYERHLSPSLRSLSLPASQAHQEQAHTEQRRPAQAVHHLHHHAVLTKLLVRFRTGQRIQEVVYLDRRRMPPTSHLSLRQLLWPFQSQELSTLCLSSR